MKLKEEILIGYNFNLNSKIVAICTGAFAGIASKEIVDKLYEMYLDLILRKKDIFFILKPHPRENRNKLTSFIEEMNPKNALITDRHLHEIFSYIDIHISSFSRTALEALASNIPILSVNPNNKIELEDFF